jgi:hypothetical protein
MCAKIELYYRQKEDGLPTTWMDSALLPEHRLHRRGADIPLNPVPNDGEKYCLVPLAHLYREAAFLSALHLLPSVK